MISVCWPRLGPQPAAEFADVDGPCVRGGVRDSAPLLAVPDKWIVTREAAEAVALAERLTDATDGEPLFGCLTFHLRYRRLGQWVNSDAGRHLGLAPIPAGPVSMLRRTLAQELARRPAGLLATKIQVKHISTVTSEGYARLARRIPGPLPRQVKKLEERHHLEFTIAAFRDFQSGVLPAGPGARSLIETFTYIDAELADAERTAPTVLDTERRIENLLRAHRRERFTSARPTSAGSVTRRRPSAYAWPAPPNHSAAHRALRLGPMPLVHSSSIG
jgi:hypothetical protein